MNIFKCFLLTGSIALLCSAQDTIPGRMIIRQRDGVSFAAVDESLKRLALKTKGRITSLKLSLIQVPEEAVFGITQRLEKSGLFDVIEPDRLARGSDVTPNDPNFTSQWHLSTIQAPSAWGISQGSSKSVIAIIDSGIDSTHPDLISKVAAGWNFLDNSSNTSDVLGHGTAVAGAAAAASNNGLGVAGVSWNSMIMPLVVLNASNSASYFNIANAITYAADNGARIINVSITGNSASSTLQSAVTYAWNKGATVFAAAGNGASSTPGYPAACDHAVAISSTENNDTLSGFSSFGTWVDLAAPGNNIVTTKVGGAYSAWYGTSFSSPIVAGVASLILSLQPARSNNSLVSLLLQNADDLGAPGHDPYFGSGRVNAYRALAAANLSGSTDITPPTVFIASPATGASVAGVVQITGTASDSSGVVKIELYVDGALVQSTNSPAFSFLWDTIATVNGAHSIEIRGYDPSGNAGSASRSVTTANTLATDTTPPSLAIVAPTPGTIVRNQISIQVSATDNIRVTQVTIYIDGVAVTSLNKAPWSFTWNTRKAASGSHVISAKGWDAAGNLGSATPVTVSK